MAKRDYYEVLGLELNCNPQDIRKSYRNLALKWHPDKHFHKKEAASKFNEIHEAYKVLTDVDQRKVYDKYGHAGLQRLQENEDYPNQAQFFFTKGFQGSDKSAFEVLYDILFERDEEDSTSPKNTDLNSDFENFMKEQFFEDETDEFEFLSNYTPTFQDPDFMFTLPVFGQERSTSTSTRNHKTHQTNNIQPSNQNIRSSTSGFNVNTMSFNSATSPFIVIEDDNEEENYDNSEYIAYDIPKNHIHQNSFMSQLNQFQNFLDDFHRTIEEDLGQFGQVNSASKKIYKKEKMGKPSYDKKEQAKDYTIPSVPIFS